VNELRRQLEKELTIMAATPSPPRSDDGAAETSEWILRPRGATSARWFLSWHSSPYAPRSTQRWAHLTWW